jgi:hypothetical protein
MRSGPGIAWRGFLVGVFAVIAIYLKLRQLGGW